MSVDFCIGLIGVEGTTPNEGSDSELNKIKVSQTPVFISLYFLTADAKLPHISTAMTFPP